MLYTVDYSDRDDEWKVQGEGGSRIYKGMAVSIGFGDPMDQRNKDHAAIVGGITGIGRVDILEGRKGPWNDIKAGVVDLKDNYLATRVVVPMEPKQLVWELDSHEGLFLYRKKRGKYTTREYYVNPPETWPFFRSYEHVATCELVAPYVEDDIESAAVNFAARVDSGEIWISTKRWKDLFRETQKPLAEGLRSAVLRASIYLSVALTENWVPQEEMPGGRKRTEVYGNID